MGRIVVTEFVTLDGVMEAPGGEQGHPHTGWVMRTPDSGQMGYKLEETLAAECLLIGRVTYESFADAWPQRTDEAGFADKMNAMPKFVVSTTLVDPEWNNTTVISEDIAAAIAALKAEREGIVLVAGSRTLVHFLMDHDLVDEYRLMVFPVVLGSGRRLFAETTRPTPLTLTGSTAYDSGVILQVYEPASSTIGERPADGG